MNFDMNMQVDFFYFYLYQCFRVTSPENFSPAHMSNLPYKNIPDFHFFKKIPSMF